MARAFGEVWVVDTNGNAQANVPVDLLDPVTSVRISDTVWADASSATTLTLPLTTNRYGKAPFYLTAGKTVLASYTVGGVTYTDPVTVVDPTAGGAGGTAPHTHPESDVINLLTDLLGKALATHTHVEGDVTSLIADLAAKAAATHTHNLRRTLGVPLVNPSGTFPLIIPLFRADHAITVADVWGYRLGGTGATLNVRKVSGGTPTNLMPADLSLTAAGAWTQGTLSGVAGVTTLAAGDSLEAMFQSETGAPTQSNLSVTIADVTS